MSNQVIRLSDYRHQRNHQRVELALSQLYLGVLQSLQNADGQISQEDLEQFLVNAVADQLMSGFACMGDVEELAHCYDRFDNALRMAICSRLAEFNDARF